MAGIADTRRLALALLITLAAAPVRGEITPPAPLAADLERFLAWFPGEYDNHEQVWQAGVDQAPDPHERLHHIFLPVAVPALGEQVFYVEQYLDDDPDKVYRQRLYVLAPDPTEGALRLTIWSFRDEAPYRHAHRNPDLLRSLTRDDLRTTPGCEVWWRWMPEGHFHGYMQPGACRVNSARTGEPITIIDDLRLTADELWIRDEAFTATGERVFGREDGIHHRNRKVQHYTGWAAVIKPRADADGEWYFMPDLRIHNEGQIQPILTAAGEPTGYSFQLALLTYQNTRQPILKLGLIEDASGETITYSWANPGADRIGINTRQIQVGLTRAPDQTPAVR